MAGGWLLVSLLCLPFLQESPEQTQLLLTLDPGHFLQTCSRSEADSNASCQGQGGEYMDTCRRLPRFDPGASPSAPAPPNQLPWIPGIGPALSCLSDRRRWWASQGSVTTHI